MCPRLSRCSNSDCFPVTDSLLFPVLHKLPRKQKCNAQVVSDPQPGISATSQPHHPRHPPSPPVPSYFRSRKLHPISYPPSLFHSPCFISSSDPIPSPRPVYVFCQRISNGNLHNFRFRQFSRRSLRNRVKVAWRKGGGGY